MLLHVVEAALPIHGAVGFPDSEGRTQAVSDSFAFVDHVQHGAARNRTGVGGLAARSRIEAGAIEIDGEAVAGRLHHLCAKRAQVGIEVVQTLRHWDTAIVPEMASVPLAPATRGWLH